MNEVEFELIDDKVFLYTPVSPYAYKTELIMTKEIFQECYKRWIEPQEKENKSAGSN